MAGLGDGPKTIANVNAANVNDFCRHSDTSFLRAVCTRMPASKGCEDLRQQGSGVVLACQAYPRAWVYDAAHSRDRPTVHLSRMSESGGKTRSVPCRSLSESARGMVTPTPPRSSIQDGFREHSLTDFSSRRTPRGARIRHCQRRRPQSNAIALRHVARGKRLAHRAARGSQCSPRGPNIVHNHNQVGTRNPG